MYLYMVHIHISTITNIFFLLISAVFGDPQRGREMARAVDLMLEKPCMKRMKSRLVTLASEMIICGTMLYVQKFDITP